MRHLAIFHHARISGGEPAIQTEHALGIVYEQWSWIKESALLYAAEMAECGVNGDGGDADMISDVIDQSIRVVPHGPKAKGEFGTLTRLWEFCRKNPKWAVLYLHTKGATKPGNEVWKAWRHCMQNAVILNWMECATRISDGFVDSVGAHWLTPRDHPAVMIPIWGGNFWWCSSDYIARLPSPMDHTETVYEAEVWLARSGFLPRVTDLAHHWPGPKCLEEMNNHHVYSPIKAENKTN